MVERGSEDKAKLSGGCVVGVGQGSPCRAYRYVRVVVVGDSDARHVNVESELSSL
jgi:hypothetical protein